jgi:hypothetical protein
MDTLGQRPSDMQSTRSISPQSYIPLELSFWARHRALIWTMAILFFVLVGFAVMILPQFALC